MKYSFSASHLHPTCFIRKNSQVADKRIVAQERLFRYFFKFLLFYYIFQVGDKEIVAQEERVQEARDRLASAIKALS